MSKNLGSEAHSRVPTPCPLPWSISSVNSVTGNTPKVARVVLMSITCFTGRRTDCYQQVVLGGTVLIRKVQLKISNPTVLFFFKSFYVAEKEKKKKLCKNPMRENKGTNRLVCDAMLNIAKNHLTQKSTDSDLAHLLD